MGNETEDIEGLLERAYESGDAAEVEELVERALELDPENPEVLLLQAPSAKPCRIPCCTPSSRASISNADIMRYSLRACSLCFTASIIVSILPVYLVFAAPVLIYSKKPFSSISSALLNACALIITFFAPSCKSVCLSSRQTFSNV